MHQETNPNRLRRYASALDHVEEQFNDCFKSPAAILRAFEIMEATSDIEITMIGECAVLYKRCTLEEAIEYDDYLGADMWRVGKAINGCLRTGWIREFD